MRFIQEQKGTVTVYLAVVFMTMIVFTGVFIDLARIRVAQNQLRRITNSAVRSVMANYNTSLKNEYGLFVVNNEVDFQGEFRKYIKVNLGSSAENNFNILGCQYENSELVLSQPIGNLETLKNQVLEDTKYSAPIDISRDLIQKFKAIGNLTQFFGEQNENRNIVKSANAKIGDIGENNIKIKEKKSKLKQDKLLLKTTNEQINSLSGSDKPEAAARIRNLQKQKSDIVRQIVSGKEEILEEINLSKTKTVEIQQEINKLANKAASPQIQAGDSLDNEIQNNLDNFQKENFDVLIAELQEIKNNVNQTESILATITTDEVIDENMFSQIELDPGNKLYDKINNRNLSGYQDLVQKLTVSRNVYMNRFTVDSWFRNSKVTEVQVPDTVDFRSEGETDRQLGAQEQMLNQLSGILNVEKKLTDMRDELYLNEYLLTHCSFITGEPKGGSNYDKRNIESEYVLYGSNALEKAIAELYMTRFTLDTLGYLVFSKPPAPVELLSRSIYALIMGAMQASLDTYKLLVNGSNTVNVIEMIPDNPMENLNLTLTYKDHLRLFMLLHSDEQGKLKRLMEVIKQRNSIETNKAFTLSNGSAKVSIKLWLLHLTGLNNTANGPFDTQIRNGRCYITKNVEFGY